VATVRRPPTGFVNVAGNGLDAFETEIGAPPSTPVPSSSSSSSSLLEIVAAYPEPLRPSAWRTSPKRPFRLRRLVAASVSAVRAVVVLPFVVLSWCLLRIWWLIRLGLLGVWGAVTGTLRLIANAFAATGRGIRDVVVGAVRLLIGAITAIASAGRATAYAIRRAIGAAGTLIARAAVAVVVGAAYAIRRALGRAGTIVARSGAAVSGAAGLIGQHVACAFAAIASALRAAVRSIRRAARHTQAESWLPTGLRQDGPAVVRRAVAGSPAGARRPRIVPVIAAACTATAVIAVGIVLVSERQAQPVAASASEAPVPVAMTSLVATTAPIVTTASIVTPGAPAPTDPVTPAAVTRAPFVSAESSTPVPEAAPALSPARVRALWSKTDTRSLDRALTSLRSATLAFRRCEMRVTSDDRAVAHCDEAGAGRSAVRVAWTIDFRRNDGHWQIDDLSAAAPVRLNR